MGIFRNIADKLKSSAEKPSPSKERSEIRKVLGPYREPLQLEVNEEEKKFEKLRKILLDQYDPMLKAFAPYTSKSLSLAIAVADIPSFEFIRSALTPEILEKAAKLEKPTLLLTPPLTRQKMIEAIDTQVGLQPDLKEKISTSGAINDDLLWSDGQSEQNLKWQVDIVDGIQMIPLEEVLRWADKKKRVAKNNFERIQLWKEMYAEKGWGIMSGARQYLALMTQSMANGKPVDRESWTILNAKTLRKETTLAIGGWVGEYTGFENEPFDYVGIYLIERPGSFTGSALTRIFIYAQR